MGDGALTGAITGAIQGGMSGYSGYLKNGACFVAGTTVATATGLVAIEKIRAGDLVWAWDEETGDVALKPVVETYINETTELTHIFVKGEEIVGRMRRTSARVTFSSFSTANMPSLKRCSMSCWRTRSRSIISKLQIITPIMYPIMGCWCIIVV